MDIFTASRFAILFKMSSSLIPVASAVFGCGLRLSLTREPLSLDPEHPASANQVDQLHIFVVVIQGV